MLKMHGTIVIYSSYQRLKTPALSVAIPVVKILENLLRLRPVITNISALTFSAQSNEITYQAGKWLKCFPQFLKILFKIIFNFLLLKSNLNCCLKESKFISYIISLAYKFIVVFAETTPLSYSCNPPSA